MKARKFKRNKKGAGKKALPKNKDQHSLLKDAMQQHQASRLEEAVAGYRQVLNLFPENFDAYNNLGVLYHSQGRIGEAIGLYQKALTIKPQFPEALNNLGVSLKDQGKFEEAIECHNKALKIRPNDIEALNNLGAAYYAMRNLDEAIQCHRAALDIDPANIDTITSLAGALEKRSTVSEAKTIAMDGLAKSHGNPTLNLIVAKCERREGQIEKALLCLKSIDPLTLDQKIRRELYFELGLLYDRLQKPEQAYDYFIKGNQTAREMFSHLGDKDRYLSKIDAYHRDILNNSEGTNSGLFHPMDNINSPVFLVGFPRSGTTLLDQILDSNPAVQTLEERETINLLQSTVNAGQKGENTGWYNLIQQTIDSMRDRYFNDIKGSFQLHEGSILVDKFPLNIVYIPFILKLFPDAKIILALRHPHDVCLSCLMQDFVINDAMANFYRIEDAALMYKNVMELWLAYSQQIPMNYISVRYEDVVTDLEKEARRIFDFIGVPWDDTALKFHEHAKKRKKGIFTPSYHQVSEKIYQRARYRWESYAEHLKPIFPTLEPFVKEFGY